MLFHEFSINQYIYVAGEQQRRKKIPHHLK